MSEADGYIPWSPRIVCMTCGDLVRKDDTRVLPGGVRSCNTNCAGERSAVELSRANARQKPFLYLPVKNARPEDNLGPSAFETEEGEVFSFIQRAVGYGQRYESVASGDLAALDGDPIGALAWSAAYLYGIVVENKRPAAWINQSKALIRTCADGLMAMQQGFGISPGSTQDNDVWWGAFYAPSATSYVTEHASVGGLALLYAYRILGDATYLDSARAAASYLRNVQAIGKCGTNFTSSDSAGTARLDTGALADRVATAFGFFSSHAFYPSDLLALKFWYELTATDGDRAIGATVAIGSCFDTAPTQLMSESIAQLRVFWREGIANTGTTDVVTGLSATTPKEFFNAFPASKPWISPTLVGTGQWEYQDAGASTGTLITGQNFAKALHALYAYEGASAQVTSVDDWLRSFTSNADYETPTPQPPPGPFARSLTGAYDPTSTLSTYLLVRDPDASYAATKENGSSVYDWGCLGLLAGLWHARHGSSFAAARRQPLGRNQRFYDGTRSDGDHFDFVTLRGKSGLSFQTAFISYLDNETGGTVDIADSLTTTVTIITPPSDPGIVFWVKGDAGANESGGFGTTWLDQSGYGQDVSAKNGGPIWDPVGINGIPAFNFTGTGFFSRDGVNLLDRNGAEFNANTPRSIYVACKPTDADNNGGALVSFRYESNNFKWVSFLWFNPFTAGSQWVYSWSPGGVPTQTAIPRVDYTNEILWIEITNTPTGNGTGSLAMSINGVALAIDRPPLSDAADSLGPVPGFAVGNDGGTTLYTVGFQGPIAEVLVMDFDTTTRPDFRETVNTYGHNRYFTGAQNLTEIGMVNDAVRSAQLGSVFRYAAVFPAQV